MPVKPGTDTKGSFFRWGKSGKKYYYTKGNKASVARARAKAAAQGKAAYAVGYKGNKMKKDKLQRIIVTLSGPVRHDEMMGRKYLVAPMSMITEGVHDGSGGPLLYPAEELFKTPQVWNHKPVVVYHPAENGEGISACDPVVLSKRQIGVIMNAHKGEVTVNKKKVPALLAEAWLEPDRMNKVDERISEAIEKNEMMELSTGLFTDNESAEEGAEWNGEKYDAIARNYRPDHLALLPDLKGACSIEDGAGFLRLNAKPGKINIIGNEMSHGNIRSLLNSWLQDKDEDVWVEDVYDGFFVFMKDGKYFKGVYSIVDHMLKVKDIFVEIVRVSEWRTLNGEFVGNKKDKSNNENNGSKRKGQVMDNKKKVKIIDALIACDTNSWGKDDKATLEAMEDATLEKLLEGTIAAEKAVENAVKKGAEEATKKLTVNQDGKGNDKEGNDKQTSGESTEDDKGNSSADEKPAEDEKPQTANEYIASAPKEIREVLESGMRSHNAIKANLIKRITDNEKNRFTEDELKAKDLPELRKLVAILPGVEKAADSGLEVNDFSGLEDVEDITENTEEPMLMPAVVGGEVKKT